MFNKAKEIIELVSSEDVETFYCELNKACEKGDDRGYRDHILNKLKFNCRYHRVNKKIMPKSTIQVYHIMAWLDFMVDKYELDERLKYNIMIG